MAKFLVWVEQRAYVVASVEVEAATEAKAKAKALKLAENNDVQWELDGVDNECDPTVTLVEALCGSRT